MLRHGKMAVAKSLSDNARRSASRRDRTEGQTPRHPSEGWDLPQPARSAPFAKLTTIPAFAGMTFGPGFVWCAGSLGPSAWFQALIAFHHAEHLLHIIDAAPAGCTDQIDPGAVPMIVEMAALHRT